MTPLAFKRSPLDKKLPDALSPALTALWWAGNDDWDRAHKIVMDEGGADCAWVHAYLHRVEGDPDNAGYWYRQAKHKAATGAPKAEWSEMVEVLLKKAAG